MYIIIRCHYKIIQLQGSAIHACLLAVCNSDISSRKGLSKITQLFDLTIGACPKNRNSRVLFFWLNSEPDAHWVVHFERVHLAERHVGEAALSRQLSRPRHLVGRQRDACARRLEQRQAEVVNYYKYQYKYKYEYNLNRYILNINKI